MPNNPNAPAIRPQQGGGNFLPPVQGGGNFLPPVPSEADSILNSGFGSNILGPPIEIGMTPQEREMKKFNELFGGGGNFLPPVEGGGGNFLPPVEGGGPSTPGGFGTGGGFTLPPVSDGPIVGNMIPGLSPGPGVNANILGEAIPGPSAELLQLLGGNLGGSAPVNPRQSLAELLMTQLFGG